MKKAKQFIQDRKTPLLFAAIMVIAAAVRLILFGSHPGGLNQDEASIGYDAWALLSSGIDRNGYTLPVHLMAWGSGQNALYAYLSMPFIALFGLNVFSVRAVNLIFSLLTVAAVYFTVKPFKGKRTAFFAMALTAAAPWNIMLARWGLESNLFPALFTLSIWALLSATRKPWRLYLAAVILALSLYSYGSAYLVITLFALICFVGFIVKKLIPIHTMIIAACVYLTLSAPIYLFMIVNVFQLDDVKIGILSIPRLYGNRIGDQSGATFLDFFVNLYRFTVIQTDNYQRNALAFYGCFYVVSLPFLIAGLYKCLKTRGRFDFVIMSALLSSVTLFGYYNMPNINRVNAIYMPLILITAVGIGELAKRKQALCAVALCYTVSFSGFLYHYFDESYRNAVAGEFYDTLDDALEKAVELSGGQSNIYVTNTVNMPYIYALFYTQTPPEEFISTVNYSNPGGMFQQVTSFSNFVFSTDGMTQGTNGIYIIENNRLGEAQSVTSEIYTYDNFSVAVIR